MHRAGPLLTLALATVALPASAQEPPFTDAQVDAVLAILPQPARAEALVMARDGEETTTLRPGSNGWTCWIERFGARMGGNCHHDELEDFLVRKRTLSSRPVAGEEPDETLAREVRSGRLAVPRASMEITAYGPVDDRGVPVLRSRRFFLYFPFATAAEVGVPDTAPEEDGPWLHEAGTVQAHLMWSRPLDEARGR